MLKNLMIVVACVAGLSGLTLSLLNRPEKMVFVEIGKVYESFSLTREVNTELQQVMRQRGALEDSLAAEMRLQIQPFRDKTNKSLRDIQDMARIEEAWLYKKQNMEKENQKISANYNDRIWNQLNQYLSDYGKEHGLSLLFGANGQGNIMYGREGMNVTEDVVTYVNKRYQGGAVAK